MLQCIIGQLGNCEGMEENGKCSVYSQEGVISRNFRRGTCEFMEIRRPNKSAADRRIRVGQQKQSKRKE